MRICIVGDCSGSPDEGFKNIAFNLSKELSNPHKILMLNVKKLHLLSFWRDLREFKPQIIHYIGGRTIKSFMILRIIAAYSNAKTIMSAFHSEISSVPKKIIRLFKPDLVLTQDYETEKIFKGLGCKTALLPNGVDTEKFMPVSQKDKEKLREKYGINKDKFVILHVGHIIKVRNLQIFNIIQGGENQVVIIGSSHRKMDNKLYESLKKSGCIVWKGYFENIEEIYELSDCYVFPTLKGYSISMPLSVLEAMACNLPVITTKFEGLTTFFNEEEGLIFAVKEEEIQKSIDNIKEGSAAIKNRDKVLPYSWENVCKKLVGIYEEAIS
jgi:glycosyltransferase involved in cell wall biosynthesis